ncbi:NAD(P)/FAD-dependent oxidoreductase [Fulvivirgaceae bacterium BMA10]|uniref:Kynurenine 3-monooxygenase n=1 Tax=Splendidivirga corallicola TaxID=3051826 RepID=A0ABT8KLD5_9BACT|nr:NAD(P)/FAD-dependent oxidoreductase [Fulvivirgaceae bacterium BMA10]
MKKNIEHISMLGAGLVGSLLSIYLAKRGYHVKIYEKRPDMRKTGAAQGRSINLALSDRGWKAIKEVGAYNDIANISIPMKGRLMHDEDGKLTFQSYGKEDQAIYSVSRGRLNEVLIDIAEKEGVEIIFNANCTDINLKTAEFSAGIGNDSNEEIIRSDFLIGADGAFSAIRDAMQRSDRFNYQQFYLEHGYKELTIPPTKNGDFAMEPNALHIWPRGQFMLIALPNMDKSFTCTLFFPFEGEHSFSSLNNESKLLDFFNATFKDAVPLMPNLVEDYFENPTSSLVTVRCYPWVKEKALIIGDAAHAIVPFYGQGMNCGFEDCQIFNKMMSEYGDNWTEFLPAFQQSRKPDADAISELALKNFIEMRDKVADTNFLLRKEIESRLHEAFPDRWVPLYSMVTFTDAPYAKALEMGIRQQSIMDEIMKDPEISEKWQYLNFEEIVNKLDKN